MKKNKTEKVTKRSLSKKELINKAEIKEFFLPVTGIIKNSIKDCIKVEKQG